MGNILEFDWYSVNICRAYPEYIFVFGDNLLGIGTAGQAIIRYEPNAFGIPTKRSPGMREEDFFNDTMEDYHDVLSLWARKFNQLRDYLTKDNKTIVFPKAGLGTGLAQLPTKAPNLYSNLKMLIRWLMKLEDTKNATS